MFSSSKHNFINDNSTKTGSAKKSALANATLDNDSLEDTCRQNLLAKLWTFIASHPKSIAAIILLISMTLFLTLNVNGYVYSVRIY